MSEIIRREDVVYGRKDGLALTMDVFEPAQNRLGIGVVFVVSGGWVSSHAAIDGYFPHFMEPLVQRGYTVFAAVVSSRPRYAIPDIIPDVKRAIRFVRHHAGEYSIDPNRIALYGLSAGGHLSLLAGLTADDGNAESTDPVERQSSAVRVITEFYGPTDFFNYGGENENAVGKGVLGDLQSAFDFTELDGETARYLLITDENRIREIAREISPITHVRADAPPTFIIHGDSDVRVPLQQSQSFVEKLRAAGGEAELVVVPGGAHGWEDMSGEVELLVDWLDRQLKTAE